MSWNDLRKGRFSEKYRPYFITFVTANRIPLFLEFETASSFCKVIKENERYGDCVWLTWVLMPDHFHGILELKGSKTLSDCIRHLKSVSAIEINRCIGNKGSVWQKAFYDHAVRKEEHIVEIARYVIANPLRAKLTKSVKNYPYWNSIFL